jgi:hypothetical protein
MADNADLKKVCELCGQPWRTAGCDVHVLCCIERAERDPEVGSIDRIFANVDLQLLQCRVLGLDFSAISEQLEIWRQERRYGKRTDA